MRPVTLTKWSTTTKRLVIAGLVVILVVGAWLVRGILPPILLAVVLAYLLKPVVDYLERRAHLSRSLAAILVFLALLVVLATVSFTLAPYLVDQVGRLAGEVQRLVRDLEAWLAQPIVILNVSFRPQDLLGNLPETLQSLVQPFATQTVSILMGIASSVLWVIAIFAIAFYLIRDADRLRAFLDRIAPPGYGPELTHLREEMNRVWTHFFRGQLVLCIIIGLVVWLSMAVLGLPSAGLMGLFAGLLEVVPNLGPVLATVPAVFIAFLQGSTYLPLSNFWFTALVVAVYALIQQTENAYLVPRIQGRRMQVHPVLVLIGVLAGGYVAGVIGVLLAAPILGTLRVVVRYFYAKLLDLDPFPPPKPPPGEPRPGDVEAILFDLDGTLLETDDSAVASVARWLRPLRRLLPHRDPAAAARRLVMASETPASRVLSLLDRVGLDDNMLGLSARLRRLRGAHPADSYQGVAGVGLALHRLRGCYRLAVVTTRSHGEAEAFLHQQGLADLVEVITGRDDTWRLKPHPGPVLHTAKRLGIAAERCLMVGDTIADVRAARAAGARSAGVLCGFGDRGELERAGAEMILDGTALLADWAGCEPAENEEAPRPDEADPRPEPAAARQGAAAPEKGSEWPNNP